MSNFFEKLKKGMGIEISQEEEKPKEEKKPKKVEKEEKEVEFKIEKIEKPKIEVKKEEWLKPEGELAIDFYQTGNELVIQSAIAGVKPEDLEISIEKDILTIEGERKKPFEEGGEYFFQECYWGRFSRQIILPVEIDPNRIEATLKEGILTIRLPKIEREKRRKIIIKS